MRDSLTLSAIKDTRNKADLAADTIGMKVAGVKSLEIDDSGHHPSPYSSAAESRFSAVGWSSIIAASQDVSVSVNVVYLLG